MGFDIRKGLRIITLSVSFTCFMSPVTPLTMQRVGRAVWVAAVLPKCLQRVSVFVYLTLGIGTRRITQDNNTKNAV